MDRYYTSAAIDTTAFKIRRHAGNGQFPREITTRLPIFKNEIIYWDFNLV
jgi:hypothetical protein